MLINMTPSTCVSRHPVLAYGGFSAVSSTLTLNVLSRHSPKALYTLTLTSAALAAINEFVFAKECAGSPSPRAEKSCLSCRGFVHLYIGTQALALFAGAFVSGSKWLAHRADGDDITRARELAEADTTGGRPVIHMTLREKKDEAARVLMCACFIAWLYMEVAKSDYLG